MRRYYKEKKEGNSFIRTLIMLLLLIVLILLSILILLYAKNSTEAMKQELYRKTQLATEQAGSNVDNILEQVEEAVFSLVGTIYPYLNQDSGVAEQITEYAEICRMSINIKFHFYGFMFQIRKFIRIRLVTAIPFIL